MKKIFIVLAFIAFSFNTLIAQQRIAYVDTEYVLKHIAEYTAAQKQLDDLSKQWQQEIDNQYQAIEKMYQAYQNDQASLNSNLRKRREDEIINKEKQVKELQRQKFGYEGELYNTSNRLIQPIQDRVSKAIQEVARAQSLDLVLEKGGETSVLFASPGIDKSNDVIIKLGLTPNPTLLEAN